MRAFMWLPFGVMFPYSLLYVALEIDLPLLLISTSHSVTLGLTWSPGEPQHYGRGQWPGLLVVMIANLIGTRITTTATLTPWLTRVA